MGYVRMLGGWVSCDTEETMGYGWVSCDTEETMGYGWGIRTNVGGCGRMDSYGCVASGSLLRKSEWDEGELLIFNI